MDSSTVSPTPPNVTSGKTAADYIRELNNQCVLEFIVISNAPALVKNKVRMPIDHTFSQAITFLRRQLESQLKPEDSLFLFVNRNFQPAPDELIGDLFRCFHTSGKLIIHYSKTPAWG